MPRKRSPSVTSSSFLRGLTNTSRASASGVAGPTVSAPRIITSLTVGPGLVDRDVDRVGSWLSEVWRTLLQERRDALAAVGRAGEAGDRARLLRELLVEIARRTVSRSSRLTPPCAADRARREPPGERLGLGVERVVGARRA